MATDRIIPQLVSQCLLSINQLLQQALVNGQLLVHRLCVAQLRRALLQPHQEHPNLLILDGHCAAPPGHLRQGGRLTLLGFLYQLLWMLKDTESKCDEVKAGSYLAR